MEDLQGMALSSLEYLYRKTEYTILIQTRIFGDFIALFTEEDKTIPLWHSLQFFSTTSPT